MEVAPELGVEMLARRGSSCLCACPWHSASHSSHSKAVELCLPQGSSLLLLLLPFLYPLLFIASLKALLDDQQGLPLKLSSPIFVYLVVIIQTLPRVQGTHSRVSRFLICVNLWKGLVQVLFNVGILKSYANGILVFCWKNCLIDIIMMSICCFLASVKAYIYMNPSVTSSLIVRTSQDLFLWRIVGNVNIMC